MRISNKIPGNIRDKGIILKGPGASEREICLGWEYKKVWTKEVLKGGGACHICSAYCLFSSCV